MAFEFTTEMAGGAIAAVLAALGAGKYGRMNRTEAAQTAATVAAADTTATMMGNFHSEIKRLADSNAEFSKENADLKKQVSRLEALLEKLCVKFDIDIHDLDKDAGDDN